MCIEKGLDWRPEPHEVLAVAGVGVLNSELTPQRGFHTYLSAKAEVRARKRRRKGLLGRDRCRNVSFGEKTAPEPRF